MKILPTIIAALLAPAAIATAVDEVKPEGKKRDPEAMFKKMDTNADNTLTLEEFQVGKKDPDKAATNFGKRDKDGDGKVTLEEFKTMGKKKES